MILTLPVREVLPATPRARILRLALEGRSLSYRPGQALIVGVHRDDHRRPYSIADAPEWSLRNDTLELLVSIDGPGKLGGLLAAGRSPSLLDVEGPIGRFTFPLNPPEQRFLFVAGGTGIAPLRAMLRHAMLTPLRQYCVVYSARTPEEFAYRAELEALARDNRIELRQTVTRYPSGPAWAGVSGRIGIADLASFAIGAPTRCFVCGPCALVQDAIRILGSLGVPSERIHTEEWAVCPPRPAAAPSLAPPDAPALVLRQTGL